ncbi:hypothetical protein NL676_019269 [Syzygium grande]|nr:hypothetical protein NL676_019269 [Syzygium grande]
MRRCTFDVGDDEGAGWAQDSCRLRGKRETTFFYFWAFNSLLQLPTLSLSSPRCMVQDYKYQSLEGLAPRRERRKVIRRYLGGCFGLYPEFAATKRGCGFRLFLIVTWVKISDFGSPDVKLARELRRLSGLNEFCFISKRVFAV